MTTISSYLTSPVLWSISDLGQIIASFPEFQDYIPLRPLIAQTRVRIDVTHSSAMYMPAAGYMQKWRFGVLYLDNIPILVLRQAEYQDPYPIRFLTPSYSEVEYRTMITYIHGLYPEDPPTGDFHIVMAWSLVQRPPLTFTLPDDQTSRWSSTVEFATKVYHIPQSFPT